MSRLKKLRKHKSTLEKNEDKNYIANLIEWQEHQYNPGFYGTKFPYFVKSSRQYGYIFLAKGLFLVCICIVGFIISNAFTLIIEKWVICPLGLLVGILYICAGIKRLTNIDRRKRKAKFFKLEKY